MQVHTTTDLVKEIFRLEKIRLDAGLYNETKNVLFSKSYASWLETINGELRNGWRVSRIKKYLKDCAIPTLSPEARCVNKYSVCYGTVGSCFTVVITTNNRAFFNKYVASIKEMLGEQVGIEQSGVLAVCIVVENEVVKLFKYIGE